MPAERGQRPGDADRTAIEVALGRHYVEGRLDAEELGRRLEALHAAGSLAEAADTLADLPAPHAASPPRRGRLRARRHGEASAPGAGWVPTTERFLDPASGRVTRVWLDPADRTRHYVPEAR